MLALPGSAYLYQGEELGLEQVDVAPEYRQDPSWFRTGEAGRDGCRVPVPWGGTQAPYDFGPGSDQPWIPQPDRLGRPDGRRPRRPTPSRRWRSTARRWPRAGRTPTRRATTVLTIARQPGPDVLVSARGPLRRSVRQLRRQTPVPLPDGRGAGRQRPARPGRQASPRHRRLAAPDAGQPARGPRARRCSGRAWSTNDGGPRRTSRRAARRGTCGGAGLTSADPAPGVVGDREQRGPTVGRVRRALDQAELDEVLDLPADRALVDVERARRSPRTGTGPVGSR